MFLKERLDDPKTIQQICNILKPREFTRLDEIVDVVFSTAEETAASEPTEATAEPEDADERVAPVAFHEACVARFEKHSGKQLIRQTRSSYAHRMGRALSFARCQNNMMSQLIRHAGLRFILIKKVSSSKPRKVSWSSDVGQRKRFWRSRHTTCSLGCQICGLLSAMIESIGIFACTVKARGIPGIEERDRAGSM